MYMEFQNTFLSIYEYLVIEQSCIKCFTQITILFCFFILLQFLIADFYYLSPNDKYIHISFDCPSSLQTENFRIEY